MRTLRQWAESGVVSVHPRPPVRRSPIRNCGTGRPRRSRCIEDRRSGCFGGGCTIINVGEGREGVPGGGLRAEKSLAVFGRGV